MRYSFILLTILVGAGCDKLWIPYCQSQPNDPSCFFAYEAAPAWIATDFKKSVLLRSMLPPESGFELSKLQAQISAKAIHSQGEIRLEIQKIRSNGDIEVELNNSFIEIPFSEIKLTLGSAEPVTIPLKPFRLACTSQTNYQKNLGIISELDVQKEVRWGGLRLNQTGSFFTQDRLTKVDSPPIVKEWKLQASDGVSGSLTATEMLHPDLSTDKNCQLFVTKSLFYQYCYLNLFSEAALLGVSFTNPIGAPTTNCTQETGTKRKIFCTKTSDPVVAAASDEDVIAVAENQKLNILKLSTQNQQTSIQTFSYPLDKKPDFLFFARVQSAPTLRPELLLLSISLDGDVRVYGPASSGEYERRVSREQILAAALAPLRALEIPIRAMALGHLLDAQIPTLVVAQGTQLWLVPLDETLAGAWQVGRPPLGAALRSRALPEPPVRLELGDLDGDGSLDLVAVGASAASVCLTKPALE